MTVILQSIFISSLNSEKKNKWLSKKEKKIMLENISMPGVFA